jgi:hypothetical protein
MTRQELLNFIHTNILDKGVFEGHTVKSRHKWYKKTGNEHFYNEIVSNTSFLNNARMCERVYCLMNSLSERKKCNCGKELEFKTYSSGYSKSCKSRECKIKHGNVLLANGLTVKQDRAKKCSITKKTKLTPEGITIGQAAGRKSRNTLLNDIIDGKNGYQRTMLAVCDKLRKNIDEQGLSGLQKRTIKAVETKRKDVVNGLDNCRRTAISAAKTMKKVQDDGLSQYQKNGLKIKFIKLNTIDDNGNNVFKNAALLAAKTKRTKIDPVSGLTIEKMQIRKMIYSRLNNIDENGLNGFERSSLYAGRSKRFFYKDTNLSYQGSFELDFLDKLVEFGLFDKVRKADVITYCGFDNENHVYHPDFVFGNNNYLEIKSSWTYDNNNKNKEIRELNNLKWKSLLEQKQNDNFFIIWNKKYIQQIFLDDFNVHDNFYLLKNRFVEFNKENLLLLK